MTHNPGFDLAASNLKHRLERERPTLRVTFHRSGPRVVIFRLREERGGRALEGAFSTDATLPIEHLKKGLDYQAKKKLEAIDREWAKPVDLDGETQLVL